MKKVLEISLGGIGFTINEDAYHQLKNYLVRFEKTMTNELEKKEVMEDVEARIAEILQKERKYDNQIVDEKLVKIVIGHLGEIEEEKTTNEEHPKEEKEKYFSSENKSKRFYRDADNKKISGVCSGIATYFNVDVTLVRVIFVAALICYASTLVLYIIIWIATLPATTIAQKLELRGIPVTAENIKKYSSQNSYK